MLSSTTNKIGLELPRDIDPCVKWKTAPKGRRRGARRGRDSTLGDSNRNRNRQKAAVTSSNGSENASDEDFKEAADQVLASESEKLSVTILRRRFSDTVQSVPIKKRMRLQSGSSAAAPEMEDSSLDHHHVDFSGISILAEAACIKSDEDTNNMYNNIAVSEPIAEVQSLASCKGGENGAVVPEEEEAREIIVNSPKYEVSSSAHVVTTEEVVNDGCEKASKAENGARSSRLHWDLNTVMDAWDCENEGGDGDGDGADYEQKSTVVVSCDTEIICNELKEETEKKITCSRNDGDDVAELVDLPKSGLDGTELRKEGDNISSSVVDDDAKEEEPIMESIIPPNQLSATDEHERLSVVSKPDETEEEIELAGSGSGSASGSRSVTEKPFEVEMEAACIKEPVSEPKDDAMMDIDETGTNNASMAVDDDKPEEHDDALQATNSDQISQGKKPADLQHNDNDNNHSDSYYPPKKDLEDEEDEYQYEDGELRETDGFKLAENGHGHGNNKQRAVTVDPPQSEENNNAIVQPDNGTDDNNNNAIVKMDTESNGQIEPKLRANDLGKNESSKLKKATGWDKEPDSLRRNNNQSPLKPEMEIVAGASSVRVDDTSLSIDDPHRNDMSFVRSRRSKEDELDERVVELNNNPRAPKMHERGININNNIMPYRHKDSDTSRRDEQHWVETRIINTGCTRHNNRATEFGAPSYAPSNSGNATAASIAKVKSNGFIVAPDGTLVKKANNGKCHNNNNNNNNNGSSSFFHGSPTERDRDREREQRGMGSSSRERFRRPSIEIISPDHRRRQRNNSFSPLHRGGHMHHISPPSSHTGSRCIAAAAGREPRHEMRGRSPVHRMRHTDYYDDDDHHHHDHHFPPPHGMRCINERRCASPHGNMMMRRRSPPRNNNNNNARFYHHQLDDDDDDEFYHHHHHHPVHHHQSASRCNNGFDNRRNFDEEEERYEYVRPERTFHRFRPYNSNQKSFDTHRRSPPQRGFNRGLVGDVNHRSKEDRRGGGFKFVTGGRRHKYNNNNGKYEKREMVRDRSGGADDNDATARRRMP